MIRFSAALAVFATGLAVPTVPVLAASFDCSRAGTLFEHAICGNAELSKADDRLARTYATAIGGLSESASGALRNGQREWLQFAQRACNDDAQPLRNGRYDEKGVSCLVSLFNSRSQVLENSRMIDGLRFYLLSEYAVLPDPERGSYWAVARHELSVVQLDEDESFAQAFNDLVRQEGQSMLSGISPEDDAASIAEDPSSDSDNSITVEEIAGDNRITLLANTYWYGRGAAHGNYTISYLHYLKDRGRWMEAEDLFTGDGWKTALIGLTFEALQAEHGENLMLDSTEYIEDAVVDPRRWSFASPYGLVIQFQPYEVSAYAYGAPTATVSWEALKPYLIENANEVRYGVSL